MSDLVADILEGLAGAESDVSPFDAAHVGDILAGRDRYTHWTALLWRLMVHADHANLIRLAHAFPKHYLALKEWREGDLPIEWMGDLPPALQSGARWEVPEDPKNPGLTRLASPEAIADIEGR